MYPVLICPCVRVCVYGIKLYLSPELLFDWTTLRRRKLIRPLAFL